MLIDDEEEKKKRLEEAMQIANRINSNNYQENSFSTTNNNPNDEYTQKLQEAMNITNSINPYTEITSSDIETTPDLDETTYNSEFQNENQEEKKKIEIFKGGAFSKGNGFNMDTLSDGYQFGDLSKSVFAFGGNVLKTAAGTVSDLTGDLVSGVASVGESAIDLGANVVASIQNFAGNKEGARKTRDWANINYSEKIGNVAANSLPIGALYNLLNGTLDSNLEKADFEKGSILGETSDKISNLIGYTAGLALGTGVLGGAGNISVAVGNTTLNLPTLAVVGGAAGGLREADSKGENVTEGERWGKAISGGLIEGFTEGLFGMFGVGGNEITDIWASQVANKMSTGAGKIFAKLGVQASGEAIEEFLSYAGNYIVDNGIIDKLGDADFSSKWDWGEVGEEMALAFVSSTISLGGESYINTNQAIKAAEEQLGRELTKNEKNSVIKAITEDALIKYNNKELFEDGGESVGNYFVANYNESGEVGEVVETLGKAIENPNSDLDILPVIIKDQQNKTFNVIDGNTGMILDSNPYTSVNDAISSFTDMVNSLSETQIKSINNDIASSTLALYSEIGKMIQERQSQNNTSQNQQNNITEQNIIDGQESNTQNNKIAQNGFSNQIKTTMEQRNWNNVSDKNIKSYQTENPEVRQEIQDMANSFQEDLANSTFGERYKTGEEWTGVKRSTTKELAEIKDDTGASWSKIQKALEDISQGKGDYALAKKVELVLDKALSEGYKNIYGKNIMPNESYLTKKGKIEGKDYLQNNMETSTQIESNPEDYRIFGERINKKGGNSNVRSEKINNNNSQQEISRNQKGKNTRGEKEISRSNGASQEKLSKSVQQFQREQQKQLGKDTKISLTEQNKLTKTEKTIQKEFENITGLNYGVYESNKGTEDAVYVNDDILVKHNSLQSKKKSNFLPFHELGHWFKVNRKTEWTAIHDIIDNTITKNQIEEYKNVIKDKSMFDNMTEAEIRDYIIEEIESDYFGNWANDISNWADMIRNRMLSDDYVQLLIDISDENISTHYNIFGTQEQQEQVYGKINEMMNNFIAENKNSLNSNSESNIKYSNRTNSKIKYSKQLYNKNGQLLNFKEQLKIKQRLNTPLLVLEDSSNIIDNGEALFIPKRVITKAINDHGIPIEDLYNLPEKLNDYVLIAKSQHDNKPNSYIVFIDQFDYKENPIMIAIDTDPSKSKLIINEITSIYGRTNTERFLKEQINDRILKINDKKIKNWLKSVRVQFPEEINRSLHKSIAQNSKNVKSSKNNTIKKSDRTLFDRNNQDVFYDYSEEIKEKNTSTYSNSKMRELIQANDIKQIDNKKQFIRTVIEREGNSYWGNMFKDSTLRDAKYKNEIIKSYLEKQNENNIQNTITTDSEGRKLTKEQQDFYKGNDVINENGDLQVVYHGTPYGKFTKFNDKNVYFFSVDRGFAEDYAYAKNFEQALDGDVEVMEVYLKAKNVFDPSKESDIQKLREALPEQIRFFATTFDKETFLQRIQRIDDLPPMWTKEQIKNAKFGRVIGDDRYGYNNDIFIGVNKNNEVVYAKHTYGTALEHLTTREQEEAKEKLLNGEDYVVTIYATPFGQMTEDAIREKYSQLENEQDKRYLVDTIRYLDEGKSYMLDDSTYKISPYTASQEAEHLTDIDNWEYIEGSNAWENNEVGKDVIDIIKDLGYDGLKIYEKGKLNYAVFNKNQIKRVDNKKPTNNPDIRYSNRADLDSEGRELSKEQQEFFKDSKVRDENGNLLTVYHGTEANAGIPKEYWFSIFDEAKQGNNGSWFGNGFYFTSNLEHAQEYAHSKGNIYETYLNITNPYIPYKSGNSMISFQEDFKNNFNEAKSIEGKLNGNQIQEILKNNGYDGIIIGDNIIAFYSNQIKNVDNKKPTNNPDIRYSNRADLDSEGRELSKQQQEYFKDSKVRDENGRLLEVYHSTPTFGFTVFDKEKLSRSPRFSQWGKGFYFTDNEIESFDYRFSETGWSDNSGTYKTYLNITNPLVLENSIMRSHTLDRGKLTQLLLEGNNDYFFDNWIPFEIAKKDLNNNEVFTKEQLQEMSKEEKVDKYLQFNYDKPYTGDKNILQEMLRAYKSNTDLIDSFSKIFNVDGIIVKGGKANQYIAFNSNQIKNVDNTNPTDNPDIRYSNRYDTEENGEGGFYSQLEKVIEEKMPNTSNAQQIKGIIENSGIKQDEIKWIGLDDYLKKHSLEKINKQQLQDYIKANQINLVTVKKGDSKVKELTDPIKEDIKNKIQDIKKIQDKYHIDYEESEDDIYYYKPNGLSAGTIGDYMADTLKRFVNLEDSELFEKQEDGSYLSSYTTDGVQWQSGITEEILENDMQELADLYDELHEAQMNLSMVEDEYSDDADEIGKPRYRQYTLDGGTNYQEILYTVPAIEKLDNSKYEVKNLAVANVSEYSSPHWQEKNVLAHVRTQDFKDTSKNKVLFIDEIQSDLHQEGRKEGYSTQQDLDTIDKLNEQLNDLRATYSAYEDEAEKLTNKGYAAAKEYYVEHRNRAIDNLSHLEEKFKINEKLTKEQQYELIDYEDRICQDLLLINRYDHFGDNVESEPYMMAKIKDSEENLNLTLSKDILEKQPQKTIYRKRALENFKVEYYNLGNIHNIVWGKSIRKYLSKEDQKRYDFLDNETDKLTDKRVALQKEIDKYKKGIPDIFPFKKNWHEFVLRRMINNAVEQGYDEVAWTTGRQQRERYNLSKVIDSIEYYKPSNFETEGTSVSVSAYKDGRNVLTKEIEKEHLADYLGKDLAMKILNSKEKEGTISNLDETINENPNSGMYLFYDQEIPNYLNKYLKKWNSKVEEITLMDADGKTESKQMGFKITDEMRNSIKQNGQPLFSNRKLDDEESSTYDERIQRKNRELIKELREQKENIQGLEGYSRAEIKDIVNRYIQNKLEENDLMDISIEGSEIIGSRNRGNARSDSDLDLVVEYSGDIREDDLFDILNEEPLEIEGIKVDINPITSDKSGTLEEYLERSKQYDKEILSKENIRKEDVNLTPGATNAQGADRFIEQEIRKIEQTGNWDNSIPVTKLTDIRETIEDFLGLGIKKGHFRQRAYGIYKQDRDVIRGKELKDIDNILHETGHALDLGNRLKIDKESIASELLKAVNTHGGYENETRSVQLDEGFAEVIRTYAIIPEQAKKDYPQSVAVLEEIRKADSSFDEFITKVQQQTYNYIHQNPQNRVHSNISIGETNRTQLSKAWIEQEVMRNVWDKDYAVKKVVTEIANKKGQNIRDIKASDNAYFLTRLATGVHDKAISMLSEGYIDENGEKIIPGLNKVGEILGDDSQRYNDLRDYLVAKRDTDYKKKSLKTGIRDMDTKYVLEKFANDNQIKEAAQVVYDTLDGVMQYAVKNGLISEEDVLSLKESNAFYVPMQRVMEGKGNQLGRKGAVSDIIKARTGSELDIKDVLENIVTNSTNVIQQVENNNVLRALYNQGEAAGLTGSIYDVIPAPMMKVGTANLSMWESELQKQGVNTAKLDLEKTVDIFAPNNKIDTKNLITSFIDTNGKRVYLQFNDEILFNSLMNLDGKMMSNVLKINSKLNMPLRYGATMANIGFAIPNMISDTAQAAIYSEAGFIPVIDNALGVLDILAATNKHVRNFVKNYSPEYANRIENMYNLYIQSGATNSSRMSQFRDSTQNRMKDVYGTKNSETLGVHEKWKPLKRLLDLMTYIPEISEQSTRFRVFEKNYDLYKSKGNSEMDARILAALESRDATQDFGRTGNLTREINQLIPFSAARVGSSYTFAEKIKANPKRTAMRIAILSAIALAIKALGYDDKEIEELIQRKKDDNFVLRAGDNIVTIKKPQGILRSIVNLTEYIEDLATGHIEEGKEGERLGEWINNAIMDNAPADSVTGLVPNMVAPLIENAINKDLYYNTDIVKSYDLELPNYQQYYEYNSQLAILLGKVFNYSPAKIDNLISGYFAGLGTQVTNIMDYTSGKLGLTAQKAEMGAESNAVGKRFIVNVNSNSASVDEIYNRKTELTKKKNEGTATEKEQEELSTITAAISNMSKVNKQIKEIKKDLTMSGKEKAEKIKELQRQRTDIARQGLGKELLDETNTDKIENTSFYPTNSSLSLNKMTLELTSEMKKEYSDLASEFYKKYEKQGLYSEEKLKKIKTKAKDYAKKTLMKKYKSQLVKSE